MKRICEIKQFSFSQGGFFSPKINIEYKEGKLHYKYNQTFISVNRYEDAIYEKSIVIVEQDIIDFLLVCDDDNIREWHKKTYIDDNLLDADGWKFCIDIVFEDNGKQNVYEVDAEGYGVFPEAYDMVIKALEKLVHESMYSRTYNANIFNRFMEDKTKGEENRKLLFEKISPMILEIIEKGINIDILEYDVREILMKYMQQAQYFANKKEDIEIFSHFIETHYGKHTDDILRLTDYFNDKLLRSYALRGFDIFGGG